MLKVELALCSAVDHSRACISNNLKCEMLPREVSRAIESRKKIHATKVLLVFNYNTYFDKVKKAAVKVA